MEHFRSVDVSYRHRHGIPVPPEANIKLRDNDTVRTVEASFKRINEGRIGKGDELKADGSIHERVTAEEHDALFRYWMNITNDESSAIVQPVKLATAVREYAMWAFSCGSLFRGNNTRNTRVVALSDIGLLYEPVPGSDMTIPTMVVLSRSGKTNKDNRLDECPIVRHRRVEQCVFFAIALLLDCAFDLPGFPVPNFVPDHSDPNSGTYGKREWYRRMLFPKSMRRKKDDVNLVAILDKYGHLRGMSYTSEFEKSQTAAPAVPRSTQQAQARRQLPGINAKGTQLPLS